MINPTKNKKYSKRGVGMSFLIITALVILSIGVIGVVFYKSTKPVYASSQVESCRISVAVHEKSEDKPWYLSLLPDSPRFCSTIYRIKGDEEVPLEKYTQDKKGAGKDIREMIADCWYMWHEGRPGVFDDDLWDSVGGCSTCFVFKIKGGNKIKDIDKYPPLDSGFISEIMNEPKFAEVRSHECAFENTGGFLIGPGSPNPDLTLLDSCNDFHVRPDNSDKWMETASKYAVGDRKCCVSSQFPNECENYGGVCITSEDVIPEGYKPYKWSCPPKRECYVKDEDYFTYMDYITRYGGGGSLLFVPKNKLPQSERDKLIFNLTEKLTFTPGEKYAIMYISPSVDLCDSDGVCTIEVKGWVFTEEQLHLVAVSTFEDAYDLGCIEGI
jgi:hypothetical protein